MRLLFDMDRQDYGECTHTFTRNSARSIIIRSGKIAMIHSRKYDHYEFPGGGIENGETPIEAMIRETQEEAGLIVIPQTIKEYGYVHRIQKSDHDPEECFVQDNYYHLCDAVESLSFLNSDDNDPDDSYQLEFIEPVLAIKKNRNVKSGASQMMLEREIGVLERLISEGLVK